MPSKFTNNTDKPLYNLFKDIANNMPNFEVFHAVVGYFRSSCYFKLRELLNDVPEIRILVGINIDDFFKPKIIYPNMTKYMPFVWDTEKYLTNQKCFIITGSKAAFLTAVLNSSLFMYCFRDSFPELHGGTRELSKIFFDKIPVLLPTDETELHFKQLVDDIQTAYTKEKAIQIDNEIFNLYRLSPEEQQTIGFIEIK